MWWKNFKTGLGSIEPLISSLRKLTWKVQLWGSLVADVKWVRTNANTKQVSELISSQEENRTAIKVNKRSNDQRGFHVRQFDILSGNISKLNQYKRIVGQQLNNDCKIKRFQCSQRLLQHFPTDCSIHSIWLTGEKTFSVATPVNSQNDCVYAQASRKRNVSPVSLICGRQHFSQNVMVSVGISRMGKTRVVFIEPGTKVNSEYYCQHILGDRSDLVQDASATCGPCSRTARCHTLPGTLWRTCVMRMSRSLSLTCGLQTAQTWTQLIMLFGVPFNRCCYRRQWFTSVEQLKRAIITEWGKLSHFVDRAKLVTGSSTSSSSKDTLNIWYEDCRRLWLSNLVTECLCPI